MVIIEGGARGVDALARQWGENLADEVETYAVNHSLDGPWPSAGPRRNARMLKSSRPDYVLAFWDGKREHSGTLDMMARAVTAGVLVCIVPCEPTPHGTAPE